jgi:hypothetical protein
MGPDNPTTIETAISKTYQDQDEGNIDLWKRYLWKQTKLLLIC